ncbi:MAG: GNAT family N-acetyltransferase [Acidilobus sp.]
MSGLSSDGLRLLSQTMDMPSIFVLGALEGTLWLDELVEVREIEGPSVVALLRSPYSGEYYVDVVCGVRCGARVAEAVSSYLSSQDSAWVCSSDPSLIDELASRGDKVEDTIVFNVMMVNAIGFRPAPRPAGFDFTGLDEHDLEAARELLSSWGEERGAYATDMIMRGNAYGAWFEGQLIGIIGTYAATADWWYLGNLFVDPEFRGRGIGKYLASLATSMALQQSREAYATIEHDNSVSRATLSRLGYRTHATSLVVRITRPR